MNKASHNTDTEIYRRDGGDPMDLDNYYQPSLSITKDGGLAISVGGTVITRTIEEWHRGIHPRFRSTDDEYPKIGQYIVLYHKLPSGRWTWVGGEVDGSDDGLFVDYDLDGQPIDNGMLWLELPTLAEAEAEAAKRNGGAK